MIVVFATIGGYVMADEIKSTNGSEDLRRLAELKIAARQAPSGSFSGEIDTERLLHELQVHQIELEMQNEELNLKIEQQENLRNIIKQTPVGYFRIDLEGRFLEVNDAWLRMHRYDSADEVIGKPYRIIQVDSSSDSALSHMDDLLRGLAIPIGEFTNRRKDGTIGHHIFSAHPVVHIGKTVGFDWYIFDISELKQIEEIQSYLLQINSLNPGEDFFESLARYLAGILDMDYVCIDRLHGDCLSARTLAIYHNGNFEDNVEYTLKETPCGDVVGKEICVFPREVRNLFPNDSALQDLQAESYIGSTLWSFDMKPIGLIAVIGRKPLVNTHFAESVLKHVSLRAAGELERNQVEAEKLLLQQQFQQAQKLESLGVLAGGIAHDFNNILAIIMGYCSLTALNYTKAEEYIPHIEKAAERAAGLCRQMLAYAGKAESFMKQLNLTALVDEMITMLKATTSHNVLINTRLSSSPPYITGDDSQLRQMVMNLIINATEAIGESHGEVRVSLAETAITAEQTEKDYNGTIIPAGEYLCLEVSDSGCGMNEETRRRIFEPFYTTKFTGRGLGMSALLGIITAHKAALQLTSLPGQGTTFKVFFPVQQRVAPHEEPVQLAQTDWRGSGTILLAEDEEQVTRIVTTMLHTLGFSVLEASNGKEALELYHTNAAEITLVIADMGMPVMDGYELFRELKKLAPELPIIISSGFGDSVVTSKIPRAEIAGLVGKPYSFAQLRDVLMTLPVISGIYV
jgi:PAS domain S-box-containing protein